MTETIAAARTVPRRSRVLRWVAVAVALYAAALAVLFLAQRSLLYVPFPGPASPAEAGLSGFRVERLEVEPGVTLPVWRKDAEAGLPTIVHFHGNGGGLHQSASRLADLAGRGFGVVALGYRGYMDAGGSPSEAAIVADARRLLDRLAREGVVGDTLVVYGWSLGSSVAIQAISGRSPRALILETPFSAAVDIAAERWPIFPVRALMLDPWRSRDHVADLRTPTLVLTGTADGVVPERHGRALYDLLPGPKVWVSYPGGSHVDLPTRGALDRVDAFARDPRAATK